MTFKEDICKTIKKVTAAGLFLQVLAYFAALPWYLVPAIVSIILAGLSYLIIKPPQQQGVRQC
ncbi:hypothetical protein [Methanosarcina sp. Kolksee]|uniref:hypothetical protein n=1 Tax=Methanosarcina sp. Kolksee TaxID=1434099 RepID=UPI00064ECC32|nr:hypothetical protein [Methanosarcina sp. Kolksee]